MKFTEFCEIAAHNPALYTARVKSGREIEKRAAYYWDAAGERLLIDLNTPGSRCPKNPTKAAFNTFVKIGRAERCRMSPKKIERLTETEDDHGRHIIVIYDGAIIWE